MPRPTPAELAHAKEFDVCNNRYLDLGLCTRCAPQAAYGHQDGFANVKPPCAQCLPIILSFPTNESGEWRSYSRRLGRRLSPQLAMAAVS